MDEEFDYSKELTDAADDEKDAGSDIADLMDEVALEVFSETSSESVDCEDLKDDEVESIVKEIGMGEETTDSGELSDDEVESMLQSLDNEGDEVTDHQIDEIRSDLESLKTLKQKILDMGQDQNEDIEPEEEVLVKILQKDGLDYGPRLTEPPELSDTPGDAYMERIDSAEIPQIEDISGWIKDINPNYDPFDADSPYSNNCGSCAFAIAQRLDGIEAITATSENIGTIQEMNKLTGMEQMSMTPDEIERYLIEKGPGTHGIVGIDRDVGPGHWFNAYYDGHKVVAIDGQTGEINDWPPDYGNVINWDISMKKENV